MHQLRNPAIPNIEKSYDPELRESRWSLRCVGGKTEGCYVSRPVNVWRGKEERKEHWQKYVWRRALLKASTVPLESHSGFDTVLNLNTTVALRRSYCQVLMIYEYISSISTFTLRRTKRMIFLTRGRQGGEKETQIIIICLCGQLIQLEGNGDVGAEVLLWMCDPDAIVFSAVSKIV